MSWFFSGCFAAIMALMIAAAYFSSVLCFCILVCFLAALINLALASGDEKWRRPSEGGMSGNATLRRKLDALIATTPETYGAARGRRFVKGKPYRPAQAAPKPLANRTLETKHPFK